MLVVFRLPGEFGGVCPSTSESQMKTEACSSSDMSGAGSCPMRRLTRSIATHAGLEP